MKRILIKFNFFLLVFLVIIICPVFPTTGKKLIMNISADATYLNPILYTDSVSGLICSFIFNGLVKINENLEIIPDLAEKWEVSKDGKIWTFYLRKNVFWHDGIPFTAKDVKFTFDKILDPKTNTVRTADYLVNNKPIKFEVISPYIFRAILPEPYAPFLLSMSMGILPEHLLKNEDINYAEFNRQPIGTGPYKFVEWRSANHLKLKSFDKYFLGKPKINEIIFRIIPNPTSRIISMELGEVDVEGVPPLYFERIKKNNAVNVFEYPVFSYTFLGLNLKHPLFSNYLVRQALAYAIDRESLIKNVLLGHGRVCYAPTIPVSWAYTENVPKFEYSPQKAKDILKSLGWKPGPDGILVRNGQRFEFTAFTNQGNAEREKAAIIIQQQLLKIGIKMNIQVMEWASLVKRLTGPAPKGFEAVFMGWSLSIDPDDYTIWHSSQYPRGFNFVGYSNPEVDFLLEKGRKILRQSERAKIYQRIYQIIAKEQPYIFLWSATSIDAVSKKLKNLSPPGPAGLFVNVEQVELDD